MADKDIKIDINVDSNTKGAKEAAKDIQAVGGASEDLSSNLKKVTSSASEARDQIEKINQLNAEAANLGFTGNVEAAQELRDEAALLYEEYLKIGEATEEATDATAEFNDETERAVEASEELSESLEETTEKLEDLGEGFEDNSKSSDRFIDGLDDANNAQRDTLKGTNGLGVGLGGLVKQLEKVKSSLFKVGRALRLGGIVGIALQGFKSLGNALSGASKSTSEFSDNLRTIKSPMAGVVAPIAAVTKAVSFLIEVLNNVANPLVTFPKLFDAFKSYKDSVDGAAKSAKSLATFQDDLTTRLIKTAEERSKVLGIAIKEAQEQQKILDDLKEIQRIEKERADSVTDAEDAASRRLAVINQENDALKESLRLKAESLKLQIELSDLSDAEKQRKTLEVEGQLSRGISDIETKENQEIVKAKKEIIFALQNQRDDLADENSRLEIAATGVKTDIEIQQLKKDDIAILARIRSIREKARKANEQLTSEQLKEIEELKDLRAEKKAAIEASNATLEKEGVSSKAEFDAAVQASRDKLAASNKLVESAQADVALLERKIELDKDLNKKSEKNILLQDEINRKNEAIRKEKEKQLKAEKANTEATKQGLDVGGALAADALGGLGDKIGPSRKLKGLSEADFDIIASVLEDGKISAVEAAKFGPLLSQFGELQRDWASGTIGAIQTLIAEAQNTNANLANINKAIDILKAQNKNKGRTN